MRRITLCIGIQCVLLCALHAFAESVQAGPVTLSASLSETSILPGQPVDIIFTVKNAGAEEAGVSLWINGRFSAEFFRIKLQSQSLAAPERERFFYPWTQSHISFRNLIAGGVDSETFPLHMRCSTEVPPGRYGVVIENITLSENIGQEHSQFDFGSLSIPIELEVRPPNDEALREFYAKLLSTCLAPFADEHPNLKKTNAWHYDFDYLPCIRSLLWAWGKQAVPYQMDLMLDADGHLRIDDAVTARTYENIAKFAEKADVERLMKIVMNEKFGPDIKTHQYYDQTLVWALHQIHRRGDPVLEELTRPAVERFSTPVSIEIYDYYP